MIPSLRYLCLEKVIAQDEDYADLPEILVRDLNLMKVFNGTYVWGQFWETVEVKIFYDGKVWNFKSRTWYHESDGEGDDGKGVCFCKHCWDKTGSDPIDFTVKEGEAFQAETSFLDFLGISRPEQEDLKLSAWKFKVDLQSNDNKHPFLVENYGEVKSSGAIIFEEVGQGESTVVGRFQIEVVNSPEREFTYLHRKVTGSVNNCELYSGREFGFEYRHVSWWRDPTTGEIHSGDSSFEDLEGNNGNGN